MNSVLTTHGLLTDIERQTRQRLKKKRQWEKWYKVTIPALLQPHLRLLRETQFLRNRPLHPAHICVCNTPPRSLKVICVYFERKVEYLLVAGRY